MNRRNVLKSLGLTVGAAVISTEALASLGDNRYSYRIPENPLYKPMAKAVTAISIGAGNRGTVYGNFAAKFPEQLKIIGVAEPIQYRNDRHAELHSIPAENRFQTWEDVFKKPKFADA